MSDFRILPKSTKEFSSKDYWDQFFTKREKNFEWYGSFFGELLKFCINILFSKI